MQIRTRLTLQFIVLVASILMLALWFVYWKFSRMAEQEFYDGLRSKAMMTAEMVLSGERKLEPLAEADYDIRSGAPVLPFRENIVIYNEALERIFAFNRHADPLDRTAVSSLRSGGEWHHEQSNGLYTLGLQHRTPQGNAYFVVAESKFDSEELSNLRNILIITFFLGIGIVALGGWLHTGQALSPVARIVEQVERIHPSDLSARLETYNAHDEMGRLVATVNRLLDRIQLAFQMQRSFISNVSHELKNPLSVIISQLEITLDRKQRSPEEYRETLGSVLEDTRNLNDIADKMLQLARLHSENGHIALDQVRLDETLLQTRASLLRLHPEYHIAFDIEGEPDSEDELCVQANEPLLRAALMNLMENGCKFSPDKKVSVKIAFDPKAGHRVAVADEGPGIPQKDLHLIFQPFFRSQQNMQVRGSGIGLSLVDTILRLHRVDVAVDSKMGRGTVFHLRFPPATPSLS
ncbi:MAG TPA: HAMP domain-containing sensor histidine kinase [Saprospiraceae bacterium]|nr:HAMP domain-containing sensor histidine kinase [Saprospiraceae bacterium]